MVYLQDHRLMRGRRAARILDGREPGFDHSVKMGSGVSPPKQQKEEKRTCDLEHCIVAGHCIISLILRTSKY